MTTRDDIVRIALAEDGQYDGLGYDGPCKYTELYLGSPQFWPAWCDIFVSWVFHQAGVPLPKMGTYISEGSQYCPQSWAYAQARGATYNSWQAQPGDQVIFDWTARGFFDGSALDGQSHTEIVTQYDASTGWLYTIGGNSGPSNVDGFRGDGGVHRHAWYCPAGIGSSIVMGVIDTSKLVTFSTTEDLVLTPEDKAYIDGAFASLRNAIETVMEGGLPSDKNPYGIVGLRDLAKWQTEDHELLQQIAAHFASMPKAGA